MEGEVSMYSVKQNKRVLFYETIPQMIADQVELKE